jgi:predicted O-methyltransferase YrrM
MYGVTMKEPIDLRIFDYDKNLLPNRYLASLEEAVTNIEEAKKKTGYSIGYPGWNLLYYSALCSLRRDSFNTMIETGTNLGCSTIILAQALRDSRFDGCVYTVELDETNYARAVHNIHNAGLGDLVQLHNEDSLTFLADISIPDNLITYAFLDGCHDQDHVVREFELIYPYLDHKSFVVFDNTYPLVDTRVNAALRHIKAQYGGNLINFENVSWSTPGLATWQKDPFHDDWKL